MIFHSQIGNPDIVQGRGNIFMDRPMTLPLTIQNDFKQMQGFRKPTSLQVPDTILVNIVQKEFGLIQHFRFQGSLGMVVTTVRPDTSQGSQSIVIVKVLLLVGAKRSILGLFRSHFEFMLRIGEFDLG